MKFIDLREKGITLIALVVTIIILLILAGVTVGFALNGSGLFDKAKFATEEYNNKVREESDILGMYENEIDDQISGTRSILGDGELVATVTATEFTEYEIPNFDSYKFFIASLIFPGTTNMIVASNIYTKAQLKAANNPVTDYIILSFSSSVRKLLLCWWK